MAVSVKWGGSFKKGFRAPSKGFGVDIGRFKAVAYKSDMDVSLNWRCFCYGVSLIINISRTTWGPF